MPRARQRQDQEGDRAEHEPPQPRRTREEDRGKISEQRDEAQKDQEFAVVRAPLASPDVDLTGVCGVDRGARVSSLPSPTHRTEPVTPAAPQAVVKRLNIPH